MPEEEIPEMPTAQAEEAPISDEEAKSTPTGVHLATQAAPEDAPAANDPDFSTLKIGDRKHFVLQDGLCEGECRPLDIVSFADLKAGLVNGRVLTDSIHDYTGAGRDGLFVEACGFDADHKPGSWHEVH